MNNLAKQQKALFLLAILTLISACSSPGNKKENKNKAVKKIDSLISAQWLSQHLNDDDLIILDATVIVTMDEKGNFGNISGRAEYNTGHIPGAAFADLTGNLSASNSLHDFIMPTQEQFQHAISELGVGNHSRIVIYSSQNEVWAARLWWMFRWAGLDQVALLDGGLKAWKAEGRPLSTETAVPVKKPLTLNFRPEVIADHDEVFAGINNSQVSIIDALPDAHYLGNFSLYARPGHIPTAINIPSSELLAESGTYKPIDELDMLYEGNRENRVISYCGGGVAAASVAFTLYRLGYTDVAIYMDSLQEWVADPANPMVTGADE